MDKGTEEEEQEGTVKGQIGREQRKQKTRDFPMEDEQGQAQQGRHRLIPSFALGDLARQISVLRSRHDPNFHAGGQIWNKEVHKRLRLFFHLWKND